MTNNEVISVCESSRFRTISISPEMDEFIRKNYIKGDSEGKFYKVYRSGNDAKYGHYMINPYTKHWRNSTFSEFYGGGIVD